MARSERLLARQLRKAGFSDERSPELQKFVGLVAESYEEFEKHRLLTDHSTRLASEELAETIESLGASERLFRSLARCSPNGIVQTDIAGDCLYANERIQLLTGRTADQLAGQGWMQTIPEADRHHFSELASTGGDRTIEHRVILGDGEVIWVSTVIGALLDGADNAVGWVANIEDITERKMHEHELSLLARHDSLTQLLNRHALRQHLDELFEMRSSESQLAIALIDLDRFKLVNDTFGHEVGDHLLVAVADILRSSVGEHDVVARLGGDEFAVATLLESDAEAAAFGALLGEALQGPLTIGSRVVNLGASVGVAVAEGRRCTPTSLLRDADTAMYRAKRSASHSFEVFDESYREEVTRRFVVESELRDAIAEGLIGLEFQPVFDAVTGKIFTVEALPSWTSALLGTVPPAEFTEVAEDLGIVGELGEQLLAQACVQLAGWRSEVSGLEPVAISLKISALQLSDPGFPESVKRILAINNLPGSALIIGITEVAIVSDLERTMVALDELRNLGVAIAIDDFGTGYSSLSYLDRLPVDFLKIDRSFVEPMGDGSKYESSNRLTETIVNLALRFGLTPVAEGVETEHQGAILRNAGCELSRGTLLAHPMSADDPALLKMLIANNIGSPAHGS